MGWKSINVTGLLSASVAYGIFIPVLQHFCDLSNSATISTGKNYPLIKFPNYYINVTLPVMDNIAINIVDPNNSYKVCHVYRINPSNSHISSGSNTYNHRLVYYEDDNYLIIGSCCLSKKYMIATQSYNSTSVPNLIGHSFVYDTVDDFNIIPSNVYTFKYINNGSIVLISNG